MLIYRSHEGYFIEIFDGWEALGSKFGSVLESSSLQDNELLKDLHLADVFPAFYYLFCGSFHAKLPKALQNPSKMKPKSIQNVEKTYKKSKANF